MSLHCIHSSMSDPFVTLCIFIQKVCDEELLTCCSSLVYSQDVLDIWFPCFKRDRAGKMVSQLPL